MVLTPRIHQIFMDTFFASCLETGTKPQTLLRDIIKYLPHETEFGGTVVVDPSWQEETRSLADYMASLSNIPLPDQHRLGLEEAKLWTEFFETELWNSHRADLRWCDVRKFAEFYLENSNLTTPLRPRGHTHLSMRLEDIIAEGRRALGSRSAGGLLTDEVLRREVDLLKTHFLHPTRFVHPGRTVLEEGGAFVTQFNDEEQEAMNGEGPILDVQSPEQYEDTEDGPNEILQERHDDNHHITPDPLKDSLREIQSIIDEDVKDLIPEGTYLILMNKMKQAYDRL
jgi:hypothetical protein